MSDQKFVPETLDEAVSQLKAATIAAFVVFAFNVVAMLVMDDAVGQGIAAVLILGMALGVAFRSRWAMITFVLFYVLETVLTVVEGEVGGIVIKLLIAVFFVRSTVAAFKYHQWKEDEPGYFNVGRILFIIASILGVPLFVFAAVFFVVSDTIDELNLEMTYPAVETLQLEDTPLSEARAAHQTVLSAPTPAEAEEVQEAPSPPASSGLQKVSYTSPAGELAGYLSTEPALSDDQVAAIVWVVGGFTGVDASLWTATEGAGDESVVSLLGEGVVVFVPTLRGVNGNPGRTELFYGEVDDVLAAVDYVKKDPRVDPERVFLAGHGTGGTLTMLAAEVGQGFRGVLSIGVTPDLHFLHRNSLLGLLIPWPYDEQGGAEDRLRSPVFHMKSIRVSTTVVFSQGEMTKAEQAMQTLAFQAKAPLAITVVEGNHFNIVHPMQEALVERVKADDLSQAFTFDLAALAEKTKGLPSEMLGE